MTSHHAPPWRHHAYTLAMPWRSSQAPNNLHGDILGCTMATWNFHRVFHGNALSYTMAMTWWCPWYAMRSHAVISHAKRADRVFWNGREQSLEARNGLRAATLRYIYVERSRIHVGGARTYIKGQPLTMLNCVRWNLEHDFSSQL